MAFSLLCGHPRKDLIMIREYQRQDLEGLLAAWYSASLLAHSFLSEEFFEQERQAIIAQYLPVAETWVYEADGKVVGFIALIDNELGAIFVHADYHRQGIGHALMAKARSLRPVLELSVFEANHIGRAFYEKCGFRQVGEQMHAETGFMQLRLKLED